MAERKESSRNLEAKDDTKHKQRDKEKSRAKTSDDLDKIKSEENKSTNEKRAAMKRSHSKSGSLMSTKSITRKDSSNLALSPADKRSGSPSVSLELTKPEDTTKVQQNPSTTPTIAKVSKPEEKPNPMQTGTSKETPKEAPSVISEATEPSLEQQNDIDYWKKRCGELEQEVVRLDAI